TSVSQMRQVTMKTLMERFISYKVPFFFSFLMILSFSCKEIVYVPVERIPTIIGTWDWVQSTSLFDPSRISTPYTEGYYRISIFDSDTTLKILTISAANNDTTYHVSNYHFERSRYDMRRCSSRLISNETRIS
ncbi:MAG TPA: hypothetical protein VGR15_02270, partial [Bacteroidota bacterium]|nr:hypothetical protein [Bacteroidota bacterium]